MMATSAGAGRRHDADDIADTVTAIYCALRRKDFCQSDALVLTCAVVSRPDVIQVPRPRGVPHAGSVED
jgi:hypothetical protein